MQIDIEAFKKKWSPEIEQIRKEFGAEGDARIELRIIAVALDAELAEAVATNDCARALPIMAALAETNLEIDAMNARGKDSVDRGHELVEKIKESQKKKQGS